MADFASMIYGTAQNAEQNMGQGAVQGLAQGAQLAISKQQLDLQQQQMQLKMQQLQQAKVQKAYDYIGGAMNYDNGGARNNYLKLGESYLDTMGLSEQAFPRSILESMKYDDNLGRMVTLNEAVRNNQLTPQARDSIIRDPAQMAQIPVTPPEAGLFSQANQTDADKQWLADQKVKAQQAFEERKVEATEKKNEIAEKKVDAMLSQQPTKQQAAQDKQANQQMQQTQQLLESARGNSAVQQAQKDLYSAQKANSLVHLYGDPNKLSQAQVNLLVSEVGKIAQGGVPSMHELDGLSPNTVVGALSKQWSRLSNDPTPANAAAFVKQYQDYSNALSNDARNVVLDKFNRVLEPRKRLLKPEDYQNLREQYVSPLKDVGTYNVFGQQMTRDQAKQFFQAHPQFKPDKQTQQILED